MKVNAGNLNIKLWITSGAVSACILVLTYLLFRVIWPGPRYLEEFPEPYIAKRAAVGMILFMLIALALSTTKYSRNILEAKGDDGRNLPDDNGYLRIPLLVIKLIVAGYFALFWYNYLLHIWFSRISLGFAYTYSDSFYKMLIGCIVAICLLGAFWIINEPGEKYVTSFDRMSVRRYFLTSAIIYIAINLFAGSFTVFTFPADISYIMGEVSLLFLFSVVVLFHNKNRKSVR